MHGLHLLDAQHGVLLVGVQNHHDVLRRYAPAVPGAPVQVVVELGFVPSPDGEREVEARIRGDRVGLLPESDAAWYRPLLERAEQLGVRPGCEGHVRVDGSGGLEVELFLPAVVDPELPGSAELYPTSWLPPAPVEVARPRRSRKPIWLGLTAAALVLALVAVVGYGGWERLVDRSAAPAAASPSAVAQPPPTSAVPVPPTPVPSPAPPSPQPVALAPTTTRLPISNGGCDPNYSGACVPIASQVECAGPGRSGPLVVRGPFRVTGTDLYQLDPDGDGIACGPARPVEPSPPPPPARSEPPASARSTTSSPDDDSSDDGN